MIECIFTKFLFFTDEKKDYLKSALSIDVWVSSSLVFL